MFRPFQIMHAIYFLPKFQIESNIISPNGVFAKIFNACGLIAVLSLHVYRIIVFTRSSTAYLDVFYYFIAFYYNYKINVYNSLINVEFLIGLQSNFSMINKNRTVIRNSTIFNWIACSSIFVFHFIMISEIYNITRVNLIVIISIFSTQNFDFQMVFASQMIKLMRINFEVWLFKAKTACEYPHRTFYRNGINSSEFWQDMYDIYLDLLKTFESYQKCFGVLVSGHFVIYEFRYQL